MIRNFKLTDMDEVLSIWLNTSLIAHAFVAKEYWHTKVHDMRRIYLPSAETIVCEIDGALVGFLSLVDNTLAALFVSPDYQRKGIGKLLLDTAKGMRSELQLTVYEENTNGIDFYTRFGFRKKKRQIEPDTGHYEFVMIWKLDIDKNKNRMEYC